MGNLKRRGIVGGKDHIHLPMITQVFEHVTGDRSGIAMQLLIGWFVDEIMRYANRRQRLDLIFSTSLFVTAIALT
jgi:hypothetical protein